MTIGPDRLLPYVRVGVVVTDFSSEAATSCVSEN
jgi:hypothetical protein